MSLLNWIKRKLKKDNQGRYCIGYKCGESHKLVIYKWEDRALYWQVSTQTYKSKHDAECALNDIRQVYRTR